MWPLQPNWRQALRRSEGGRGWHYKNSVEMAEAPKAQRNCSRNSSIAKHSKPATEVSARSLSPTIEKVGPACWLGPSRERGHTSPRVTGVEQRWLWKAVLDVVRLKYLEGAFLFRHFSLRRQRGKRQFPNPQLPQGQDLPATLLPGWPPSVLTKGVAQGSPGGWISLNAAAWDEPGQELTGSRCPVDLCWMH